MTNKNTVTTTLNTETTDKDQAIFAIPMETAHYDLVTAACKQLGIPRTKFGRGLVLAEAARVMGVEIPVVVEGKRGPKGGSKHPLAVKHNLTTVEFNKRLAHAVAVHAASGSKKKFDLDKVDFSIDPSVKDDSVQTESTEVVTVDTAVTA